MGGKLGSKILKLQTVVRKLALHIIACVASSSQRHVTTQSQKRRSTMSCEA